MGAVGARMHGLFSENGTIKLLALGLAVTMVVVKKDDKVSDVEIDIPIKLEYPDNRILTTPALDKVRVTVRGSYGKLKKFDPQSVPPISLNLSGFEDSQETFETKQVRVPPGLDVARIKPSAMVVRFEERTVADILVKAATEGQPQSDYQLESVSVSPKTVKVIGAKSVIEGLEFVRTQAISLVGRTQTFSRTSRLAAAPFLAKYAVEGQRVEVRAVVVEKVGERLIKEIEVHVLQDNEDDDFVVSPAKVSVEVSGSMRTIKAVDNSLIDAYVDTRGVKGDKMFTRPIIIEAPEGVLVKQSRPEAVTLVRKPPEVQEPDDEPDEEDVGGQTAPPEGDEQREQPKSDRKPGVRKKTPTKTKDAKAQDR